MIYRQAYITSIKTKKSTAFSGLFFNHPNRLLTIGLSGSASVTVDERSFTGIGNTAKLYTESVDFSICNPYTRVFYGGDIRSLATDQFLLAHDPYAPWLFDPTYGGETDYEIVGTSNIKNYSRASSGDPWVLGSETTEDIESNFVFTIVGGGDPISGGLNTDPEGDASIFITNNFTSANVLKINDLFLTQEIFREPQTDSWASESTLFSDTFDDEISANNTADGGGWSGSCSLSVDFGY